MILDQIKIKNSKDMYWNPFVTFNLKAFNTDKVYADMIIEAIES